MAGKWIQENHKNEKVLILNNSSHLFNFYSNNPFTNVIYKTEIKNMKEPFWLYLKEEEDFNEINKENIKIVYKKVFPNYPVTKLKLNFLLENKRAEQVSHRYLIKIKN
ncbi:MAG: hypothetical protein HC854_07135 [Flavobacterium sp.]|nr:hypothetical protein [Flavobacterium sp.]